MKKRLLIIGTLVGSILVMTACGGKKEETPAPAQEAVQEAAGETEAAETEAAQEANEETEAVQEVIEQTEADSVLEDFTGDMDLSGSWDDEVSKRASMDVTKNEDGSYNILVHWGGSATETAIWEIHGEYDPNSGMLSYEDGAYSIHTFDDKGNETVSGEEKTKGAFMKEGEKLRWQDSKNTDDGLFSKSTE